ncbi:hypothetical protein TNCV_3347441 [Trichonephila clavipes]|nr:hypothetical protein TNCV_3347441 [Trichonephila clavipes]
MYKINPDGDMPAMVRYLNHWATAAPDDLSNKHTIDHWLSQSRKAHSDLNHDSSIGHQLPANFHPLSQIAIHCHFVYSKFRYLKACLFASFIHTSLLGFGWKSVAINSSPKNPEDMLKKRRVSPSYKFIILKDNWGRWKQHSRTLRGSFMARRKPHVLTLGQSVFGDRPRNFEPWSSDEDDTWADTPSPNFHTTPTGRHWSLNTFIVHRQLLYGGSSAVLDLNS